MGARGGNSAGTGLVLGPAGVGLPCGLQKMESGTAFVELQWSKRPDGSWWRFADVEAAELSSTGVFVVWQNGSAAKVSSVLYVGRGFLRDQFVRCHRDPIFRLEGLYVTWAAVHDLRMLDSIASYLYQRLHPLWGEAVFAPSMAVNLPLTG
jgi:hypothetical protein